MAAKKKAAKKKAASKSAKKKSAPKTPAETAAKGAAKKSTAAKSSAKESAAKTDAGDKQRSRPLDALLEAVAGADDAPVDGAEVQEEDGEKEPIELLPPMPKMPKRKAGSISLAFGTGADQAFMVYALSTRQVDTEDRTYELVRREIQDLEEDAERVVHDVTTISFGAYPQLRDRYLLLACGGAYGDHQGPILVARKPIRAGEVDGLEVAVPGLESASALTLKLWLPQARLRMKSMPVREISLRVRAGHVRSGLLVNEDLVTYRNHNLVRIVDLGQWWGDRTEGLPVALTTNVIRRDIPEAERVKIALDIKRSIAYALGHREEALDWAMQFAGRNTRETLDRFIARYVNDLSLDCGERGRQAARLLFQESKRHRFLAEAYEPVYHGDPAASA